MKNTYQFVTCLHGNEVVPRLALESLGEDYLVANPEAILRGVRYVEKDMNASFGANGSSVEEKTAKRLLKKLLHRVSVIDFHTMPVKSPPFAIVTKKEMIPTAKKLGLKHIVYMRFSQKHGHALIDHCDGVSVETGEHGSLEAFRTTKRVVCALKKDATRPAKLYEVYGEIKKFEGQVNFQLFLDGEEKYYPVLAGNLPFRNFGLKARIVKGEI